MIQNLFFFEIVYDDGEILLEYVFCKIQSVIVSGEIVLGSKIFELELVCIYGISCGLLCEVIYCLEGLCLLVWVLYVGVWVVLLSYVELIEFYEICEFLEGMVC